MLKLKLSELSIPITLSFIVIFFVAYPFMTSPVENDLLKMAISLTFVIIPCLSMFVKNIKELVIASSLALLSFLLLFLAMFFNNFLMLNLVIVGQFSFFLFTLVVVFRHIFSYKEVTLNKILCSILGYLLIAFLFAFIFTFASLYNPDILTYTYSTPDLLTRTPDAYWDFSDTLYFSLVTLTSLGYGDISPLLAHARMFAALEAVVGQMYLAVFVARLVGLMISQSVVKKEDEVLKKIEEAQNNEQ